MLNKIKKQYLSYPLTFRVLIAGTFIDRIGGALIFPFLSLYVAQRFNVGMTEVGLLFGIWSVSSLIGSMIGGALADKFGRKIIMISGLVFSATSALLMGFVKDLNAFYLIAAFSGIFSDMAGPAQQAMVADLLKGEQRAEGYGLVRVVGNLAMTIGPAIGGVLAGISYLLLFIIDAVASIITAFIVFKTIPETKPQKEEGQPTESIARTLAGYALVAKDGFFMAFIAATVVMVLVYTQMYSTLSVFLNRVHGISAQGFGYLMSMNAAMVVIMQFSITRKIRKFPPMLMMMAATFLYGIGYTMFGFVGSYGFFALAMATITMGEMIHIPVAQTLVASFAPEDMRARYMATYGIGWAIPNSIAPTLAGLVMDNYDPNWVWYLAGMLSLVGILFFWILYLRTRNRLKNAAPVDNPVV
jgi:MFS family permease